MKLTVGDIRFSESGYASATVGVGTGTFPFLLFSICKMDVSVPVVDGKEIKDYDEYLLYAISNGERVLVFIVIS